MTAQLAFLSSMYQGPGKGFYSFISQMCDELWVCARPCLGLKGSGEQNEKDLPFGGTHIPVKSFT